MAAPAEGFFPISEISTYQTKWVIRARVTNKSPLRSFANKRGGGDGKVFHVELLDASGGEIRASFFNEVADRFFEKLQVGKCYTFSRGSVKVANRQYNSCNHRYEITFEKLTQVEEAEDGDKIGVVKFAFVDLRTCQTKSLPCTVDLCGIITSAGSAVSFTSKEGKSLVKREITIADDSATTMSVTLWGDRAQKADSEFQGTPLVAIKGVLVKEWQQGRSGSLLESGHLELNPDVSKPEFEVAQKVLEWWNRGGSDQKLTALSQVGMISGGIKTTGQHLSVVDMRRAADAVGETQQIFTITCRLTVVQTRKQGEAQPMLYMACLEPKEQNGLPCNRRVDAQGFCAACNRVGKAGPKLNLRCRFADYSDSCWLTCFHEASQKVVSMSSEQAQSLENSGGREALENALKAISFKRPLQVTVRAKLDNYNGDVRTNITAIDAAPVNRRSHGRQMLAELEQMLY